MNLQRDLKNANIKVVRESEENYEDNSFDKWKYSIYSALVFLIISSPYTYLLIHKLFGSFIKISSLNGCPTLIGLFIHSAIFAIIIRGMMELNI